MKPAKKEKTAEKKTKKTFRRTTVNDEEIRQFDALGDEWWNPNGPMRPLHRLNPVRLDYIRRAVCQHFDRDPQAMRVLDGLRVADIGCGGGIVAEPLCRMGGDVTGIDAGKENIRIAKAHAKESALKIDYRTTTVEAVASAGEKFDIVTALEVVEHVDDLGLFMASCCKIVKKDGLIILSTLNRTPKSFLLGIVAAEHILRWLPVGTHNWKKFVKPSELARELDDHGFKVGDVTGLTFNPLKNQFALDADDIAVNYLMTAARSA